MAATVSHVHCCRELVSGREDGRAQSTSGCLTRSLSLMRDDTGRRPRTVRRAAATLSRKCCSASRRRSIRAEANADGAAAVVGQALEVEFVLVRECCFGQKFYVAGSAQATGRWDLAQALKMQWHEGHVWRVTAKIAPEDVESFEFKYVKQGQRGEVEWQPSANHSIGDGTGINAQNTQRPGLLVLWRPWGDEELLWLPEDITSGASNGAAAAAAGTEAEAEVEAEAAVSLEGEAVASNGAASRRAAALSSSSIGRVVERDAEWGRSVLARLLGTWGRKTLMEEEEESKKK